MKQILLQIVTPDPILKVRVLKDSASAKKATRDAPFADPRFMRRPPKAVGTLPGNHIVMVGDSMMKWQYINMVLRRI